MKKIILFVLMLLSCSIAEEYTNMKSPEVSDCTYGEGCIQITFSSEMEREITEQAFSCLCNAEAASGTFIWYEKKMCFYPEAGIKDKSRYQVEVGTRAEDRYGNSLREVFSYIFSTVRKEEEFFVQKMNISDGDMVSDLMQLIEITFSSPVEQASFYQGFGISPHIPGAISFNGNSVLFAPLEKLDWNSTYTVTLKKSISDSYGNRLQSDYAVTFATPQESDNSLKKICIKNGAELVSGGTVNRNIEKDISLVLTYSGAADSKTIKKPVSVSPVLDYTADWNIGHTCCTISFKKPLPYKALLELTAGEGKQYLLYVDGERSRPLEVQEIRFYQDYSSGESEVLEYGSGIVFETGSHACFEFLLSAGNNGEILAADAYGAVDVAVSRGNLTIDIEHLETGQREPGSLFIRLFCSITAGTIQTPVIISVNGMLQDSDGNTLEKDYVLRINAL